MKDILKRVVIGAFSVLFLVYLWSLFTTQQIIVQTYFVERNTLYYIILALAFLYVFIFFSAKPVYLKISKVSLFVLGISLIVLGDTVLINNISSKIYLGDISKVFGVIFTLLAFTNFFVTNKVKKQKEDSIIEIIEA